MSASTFPFHPNFVKGDFVLIACDAVNTADLTVKPESFFRVNKADFAGLCPIFADLAQKCREGTCHMHESAATLAPFIAFGLSGDVTHLAGLDLETLLSVYDTCHKNGMSGQRAIMEDHILTKVIPGVTINEVGLLLSRMTKYDSVQPTLATFVTLWSGTHASQIVKAAEAREQQLRAQYQDLIRRVHELYDGSIGGYFSESEKQVELEYILKVHSIVPQPLES